MGYDGSLKFDTKIDASGFSSGIEKIGSIATKGLAVLGAAVTASTGVVVKLGMDFESQMSKVQAISGATGDELLQLTDKAKEMGKKTKFSATESAQALEYMAMAGWKTDDMLGGLEGIMNLAAASGEDLASTSDIVTDALTAFGMAASDSGHFADILATASSNANTNVGMMGETFKYVAPVAGALGFSAEDTALAIGLMANSGIKAGQAGTSLRAILSRMAKPTKEVQSAMDELGISLTNSDGSMKSLNEIMGDLRNGFASLSEAEKAEMASALGGQEAMSGLLAIVNASDDDFNKLSGAIANCDGAAADMAETMNDNLKGKLTILKSSLEGLGLDLYESIESPLKDLASLGIDAVNELTEAFEKDGASGLITAGSEIIANLITGIIEQTPNAISMASDICGSMVDAFSKSAPRLLDVGKELFQYFMDGINQITENAPAITEKASEIISSFMQGIGEAGPQLIDSGAELLASFVEGIAEQLPNLVPQGLQLVVTIADAIISNLPKIIDAGIALLKGLVQGLINSLPLLITEGPRLINDFADAIYSGLGKLILTGLQMIASLIAGLVENIPLLLQNVGAIFMAILNVFTLSKLVSLGKSLMTSLGEGIKGMLPNITSAGKNIISGLVSGIKSLITHPVTTIKGIITNIRGAFTSISWGSIGSNIISGIAKGITASAGAIVSAAKNAAKKALDSAKSFLGIHSPSTVFRDQVGKNMALGMGVGFEKNIPIDDMNDSLSKSVDKMRKMSYSITTNGPSTVDSALSKTDVVYGDEAKKDDDTKLKEIVIHTHVDLDGKEVGNSVTKYVDQNMSDDEDLRRRGN